ncbi:MAG: TolC family protein [Nitrospiraceae bacterium]|jgi:outer membrane protein, heavy metal efflux system|nr:MAG: TolC family protein [Nitrospiraceae bacterium]
MRINPERPERDDETTGKCILFPRCFVMSFFPSAFFLLTFFLPLTASAESDRLSLRDLIQEALKSSPEILSAQAKTKASEFKIPQAESLPDPMFMFGYQNEGFERYTYGESPDAKWMFSLSQMFPYPGKLSLKGEMTTRDTEGQKAFAEALKLRNVSNVKSLYYDLFLSYRDIDLIREKTALFERIEEAALSRYSTGMAMQQEVLMAQTEKYMLMEREEMLKQKIESTGAMLNAAVGREVNAPLSRPDELSPSVFNQNMEQLLSLAVEKSPELKIKQKMLASSEIKERMAEKDYYPDFTVTGTYEKRSGGDFLDMWSLTTAFNIPLFYKSKQRQAVYEAKANREEAVYELEGAKLMITSAVRDNYSMMKTAERLMELYKNGLIPKTYQDFEAALAGYIAGKGETLGVITRLKSLVDFEMLYWRQFVEREKAIARLDALTGTTGYGVEGVNQ